MCTAFYTAFMLLMQNNDTTLDESQLIAVRCTECKEHYPLRYISEHMASHRTNPEGYSEDVIVVNWKLAIWLC